MRACRYRAPSPYQRYKLFEHPKAHLVIQQTLPDCEVNNGPDFLPGIRTKTNWPGNQSFPGGRVPGLRWGKNAYRKSVLLEMHYSANACISYGGGRSLNFHRGVPPGNELFESREIGGVGMLNLTRPCD